MATTLLGVLVFALDASAFVLPSKRAFDVSTNEIASRIGNGAAIGDACHPPNSYRLGGGNDPIPPCISEQAISLKCEQWMGMSVTASAESRLAYKLCMVGSPSTLPNDVFGCLACKVATGGMSQNDNQIWTSVYKTAFANFGALNNLGQPQPASDTFWNGYVKPLVETYPCGNAHGWACFRPNPTLSLPQPVDVRSYYPAAPGSQNCGQFNYNYNLNGNGNFNSTYGPPPQMPGQVLPVPGQVQPVPGQVQPVPGQVQPVPGQVQPVPMQTPPGFVSQVWYRFDRYVRYQLVQGSGGVVSTSTSTGPGGSVQAQVGLAPSAYYFLFTGSDDFIVRTANGPVVPIQGFMASITPEQARQLPPSCGCGYANMQTYSQQYTGGWQRAPGVQANSFMSSQQDWGLAYSGQSTVLFNTALDLKNDTTPA